MPIRRAYRWVRAAAHVLANHDHQDRAAVQQAFVKVLRSIGVTKRHCGVLEEALTHFLKVTRSYRSGLFHCYDDPNIPRTNNDLEQCFGQNRFHERRATGRKRGAARVRSTGRECRHPPAPVCGSGYGAARPRAVVEDPSDGAPTVRAPDTRATVPARPAGLSRTAGGRLLQASFAVLGN